MSEIIAEGILEAGTITKFVETLTSLTREARVHFNDDGLEARVVDPANVCMINPITLDASAFESYDSPGSATIGVPLNRLEDRLGPADADELVHLAVDMETRKLVIEFGRATQRLRLIDPESIRKEPDSPDLDLPNRFTIEGSVFEETLKFADMVSDHVVLRGHPDEERVQVIAQGDVDDTTVDLDGDDIIAGHIDAETESLYSLDYLLDVSKPIPGSSEVTFHFGNEFPVHMEWLAAEETVSATAMLAPRIRSE